MEIDLIRKNKAYHFEAKADVHSVNIDANPAIGGEGKGCRPMELMLMGIAGCVSIDLGLILKKQRMSLIDYSMKVKGIRKDDGAKEFIGIHLIFNLQGELEPKKVQRAIDLSIEKYCSAIQSLDKSIKITNEFHLS